MKKSFFIVILTCTSVFGQLDDQSYLSEYKKATTFFNDAQYDLAIQKLNPLCSKLYKNAVTPYAYFFNALANKNKGNHYQARVLLRQIFDNYYDWDKADQARIIYADLNFDDNFFEEALKSLDIIQDPKYKTLKNNMLETYLPNIQSLSVLKDLYFKFPTQEVLAKYLVKKIQSNKLISREDLELSDLLTNRYKFKDSDKIVSQPKRPNAVSVGKLTFGVLLPFEISNTQSGSLKFPNQYIYDLYEGMKIASDKLEKDGIHVNLKAFDVNKLKSDFQKIEQNGSLKDVDLIFGPLYGDPNTLAVDFVNTTKIVQVHPLSNNAGLLKENKKIFLAQPSYKMQAKKALMYIENINSKKEVSIYFGPSRKDSVFAEMYKSQAKALGYKIVNFKKFNGTQQKLDKEDGHIFLAADNNLGTKFLHIMNRSNVSSELICTAASFNWNGINRSLFGSNVSIIYPEFVDKTKQTVIDFNKEYLTEMATRPSYFAYAGYDMVLYFARMMKDGKDYMNVNIETGPYIEDMLLSGFDYSDKVNDNEIVPIVKYNGENFEEIYR